MASSPDQQGLLLSGDPAGLRKLGAVADSSIGGSRTASLMALSSFNMYVLGMAIGPLYTANCMRELRTSDVVTEQRADFRVVRAGERILRGRDFNVVGYTGLKAPLRKRDFLIGQLRLPAGQAPLGARAACNSTCPSRTCSVTQIPFLGELLLRPLLCQCRALPLSAKPSAGEDGNAHIKRYSYPGVSVLNVCPCSFHLPSNVRFGKDSATAALCADSASLDALRQGVQFGALFKRS